MLPVVSDNVAAKHVSKKTPTATHKHRRELVTRMKNRQKPADGQAPTKPGHTPLPVPPQRQTEDQRWQRTVRFNWDNGGKRGGNKDGRK